jgi:hypothetical protein
MLVKNILPIEIFVLMFAAVADVAVDVVDLQFVSVSLPNFVRT